MQDTVHVLTNANEPTLFPLCATGPEVAERLEREVLEDRPRAAGRR